MAKKTDCDICGADAVTTAKFGTTTTTALEFDLCQKHIAQLKEIMRAFTKQDVAEVVIEDGDVKVDKTKMTQILKKLELV